MSWKDMLGHFTRGLMIGLEMEQSPQEYRPPPSRNLQRGITWCAVPPGEVDYFCRSVPGAIPATELLLKLADHPAGNQLLGKALAETLDAQRQNPGCVIFVCQD